MRRKLRSLSLSSRIMMGIALMGLEKKDRVIGVLNTIGQSLIRITNNFPNTGKLLMLLFILFAGWFVGERLSFGQYPTFVFACLFSFFGGVDVAMPFMLDLMRLPSDLYQLYVITAISTGRFATLLAAMM